VDAAPLSAALVLADDSVAAAAPAAAPGLAAPVPFVRE
jgi:hypothetical protein